jgi:hypothetical protein
MADKIWKEMNDKEKLEWLHDTLKWVMARADANSGMLDARHREIISRLEALEAKVKSD